MFTFSYSYICFLWFVECDAQPRQSICKSHMLNEGGGCSPDVSRSTLVLRDEVARLDCHPIGSPQLYDSATISVPRLEALSPYKLIILGIACGLGEGESGGASHGQTLLTASPCTSRGMLVRSIFRKGNKNEKRPKKFQCYNLKDSFRYALAS